MPTFYIGPRPVLKGRNSRVVNPYTGKVGEYSNWDLFNTSHVLDGAPDYNYIPGAGLYPHGVQFSRWFRGLDLPQQSPMYRPGDGARLDPFYFRQAPYQWKGVPAGQALAGAGFGHAEGAGVLSEYAVNQINYRFLGVPSSQPLAGAGLGHQVRYWRDPAVASGFGASRFFEYQGVPAAKSHPMQNPGHVRYAPSVVTADPMPGDYGQVPAQTPNKHYGFEHVQEWFGVPSAKAL